MAIVTISSSMRTVIDRTRTRTPRGRTMRWFEKTPLRAALLPITDPLAPCRRHRCGLLLFARQIGQLRFLLDAITIQTLTSKSVHYTATLAPRFLTPGPDHEIDRNSRKSPPRTKRKSPGLETTERSTPSRTSPHVTIITLK